jgi:hypothetical protein
MTPDESEQFDDEEAALTLECGERLLALERAKRCSDPDVRDAAVAYLFEEFVQSGAQLCEETLAAADAGEIELTDEAREVLLEGIELAIDRPDWYIPGARVILPPE